jgi:hypothetical protein
MRVNYFTGFGRAARTGGWIVLLMLAACEAPPEPVAKGPIRWKEPAPTDFAAHVMATDAAALAGDRTAVQAQMQAAGDSMRRSMKLADPARRVDHELARTAAKRVEGVRSAVWLDRENLFAIVAQNGQKSQQTIDAICTQLDPLGDTLGVVVNLQSGAATTGDELEILSRNCQLEPGDRAYLQRNRQVDVLSPAIRAQHKANQSN